MHSLLWKTLIGCPLHHPGFLGDDDAHGGILERVAVEEALGDQM